MWDTKILFGDSRSLDRNPKRGNLPISVQHPIFLIATGNGIQDLEVVGRLDKGSGIVAIVQDVLDVHLFKLQQFGERFPVKF